jgi:hypothetical protein
MNGWNAVMPAQAVIPAEAGTQGAWIPACAGMTHCSACAGMTHCSACAGMTLFIAARE